MPPVGLTRCLGGQAPWKRLRYKTKFPGFRGIFAASGNRMKDGWMPQGKERNGCGATLAASRRSHIFFAQANTTGKSKDRNGCSVTLQKTTIGGYDEQGNGAIAL